MKSLLSLLVLIAVSGCSPRPDTPLNLERPSGLFAENTRFSVTRVGVLVDGLAYGDRRGIYLIVDTKTGAEYMGLSGVGVAETGSHLSNKHSAQDER